MTDETMTTASEPAADTAAPEPKAEPSKPASIADAIRGAMQRVEREHNETNEAADVLAGRDPNAPKAEAPQRGPDGKFLPKDGQPKPVEQKTAPEAPEPQETAKPKGDVADAPARFSPEAKQAWADAPEPVRKEVTRAIQEMEGGISKYRERASMLDGLDEVIEAANKNGKALPDVVQRYYEIDQALGQDVLGGLDMICNELGVSLHDVASAVLGQDANQHVSQAQRAIAEKDAQLRKLESELKSYREEKARAERDTLSNEITTFFSENPDAEPLRAHMGRLLQQELANDLPEAYRIARRLYGDDTAPLQSQAQPATPPAALAAQTRKGQASISGAPSAGSNPGTTRPPSSARDALRKAFAVQGIPINA